MATKLTIINAALITLGKEPLATLDNSARATAALVFWDLARDELLRAHPWNFAMKRAVLPAVAEPTAAAFGYASAYNLPADCLRLCECSAADYTLESGQVLCNTSGSLQVRYVARVEDATRYDASAAAALGSLLASYLAYPLTQSASQQEMQYKIFTEKIRLARGIDAQEQPSEEFEEAGLIRVRGA
jgi:hypothetical protein